MNINLNLDITFDERILILIGMITRFFYLIK